MELNAYYLRRWSTSIRVRDGFICYVCSEKIMPRSKSQAHHIYPKSIYPDRAYDLDNGACVCSSCHHPIVHSTNNSWKKFTYFFKRYVRLVRNNKFNKENQHKIIRKK